MHWGSGVARVSAGLSGDKARSTSRGGNGVALHRMSSDIQSTSTDGRAPSSMVARSGIDQGHLLQNLAAGREARAGFATNAAASPAQGQAQQTLQTAAGGSPSAGQQTVQLPCAHITEQLQTTAGREQQGASPGGNSFAAAGQGSREAAKAPASSPGACHAAAPAAKPPAGPIARPVHASSTASSDTIGGGGGGARGAGLAVPLGCMPACGYCGGGMYAQPTPLLAQNTQAQLLERLQAMEIEMAAVKQQNAEHLRRAEASAIASASEIEAVQRKAAMERQARTAAEDTVRQQEDQLHALLHARRRSR